jgi:molybdopterin synthase catalytic subunit
MYLTYEPIDSRAFLETGADFFAGASVLFLGIIRRSSEGKEVEYLEYEAFEPMAERLLGRLVLAAFDKWKLEDIQLVHRLGRLGLGEIAVAIQVSSCHRGPAYDASRFLIEAIKKEVPIWKKEYFKDGTAAWSLCGHVPAPEGKGHAGTQRSA